MKKLSLIALALAAPASAGAQDAAGALPQVALTHQGLIERYCQSSGRAPDPVLVARIEPRLAEFAAAWAAHGPRLMAATVAVTGQRYRFAETIATLHACPDMASMSAPLLIDVGRYLGEAAEGAPLPPRRLAHFAYTLWHELEHRHIGDILRARGGRSTRLLERHAGENPVTRNHLHLLAVEQMVLRSLGREEEFHARGRAYAENGNRPYARAYEIVVADGAEGFVAELREG